MIVRFVRMIMVVYLIGVDYIMPRHVGRGGYGGYGVEIGEGEPYGEHSILLAEGLPSRNFVAETGAYFSPYEKLYKTCCHRTQDKS